MAKKPYKIKAAPAPVGPNGNGYALGGRMQQFAYDATEDRGKRKAAQPMTRDEDQELKSDRRRRLVSGTRDLPRNFAIAAWAIRKHLDYVSSFQFQSRTGDRPLDTRVEYLVKWWGRKRNFDVREFHSQRRMVRLWEACRTIDGDLLIQRLVEGRLQTIEGDRVRMPTYGFPQTPGVTFNRNEWVEGVRLNEAGKAIEYAVCARERESSNLKFQRTVSADSVEHLGYFENRIDQVRGISPLAAAVNSFRDSYEAINFALAKAKVTQLFAMVIARNASDQLGNLSGGDVTSDPLTGLTARAPYTVDFDRGPVKLELDPGDEAKFLESTTPSREFQAFMDVVLSIALKSLDIPVSFYDEGRANFSSSRQAWILYNQSASAKRDDLRDVLDSLTAWRMRKFILDGWLELPAGWTVADLKWEWLHTGIPWIDPLKEVTAQVAEILNGLNSRTRLLRERGIEFEDIYNDLAYENELLTLANLRPDGTNSDVPALAAAIKAAEENEIADKK